MDSSTCTANLLPIAHDGGCNFCTRNGGGKVWEIKSKDPNRHLSVRLCPFCMSELKAQTSSSGELESSIRMRGFNPDPETVGKALEKLIRLETHASEAIRGFKKAGVE